MIEIYNIAVSHILTQTSLKYISIFLETMHRNNAHIKYFNELEKHV